MRIHLPKPLHGWRAFIGEVGVIVLGVLIALAAGQLVETIHHANQRAELREALDTDSRQAIIDARRSVDGLDRMTAWFNSRIGQARTAIATGSAIPQPSPPPKIDYDIVVDPSFQAAKSSGLLTLLSQREIIAYSEADAVTTDLNAAYEQLKAERSALQQFAYRFRTANGMTDYSTATPDEKRRYLELLIGQLSGQVNFRFYNNAERGLQAALLRGERDLKALQKSERTLNSPAPGTRLNRM